VAEHIRLQAQWSGVSILVGARGSSLRDTSRLDMGLTQPPV
jgi:hypothetical protein